MIECKGIVKEFPGVRALDQVSFTLAPKKITGVLGENGAGKSTLMNILFGLTRPDAGKMLLNGHSYHPRNPSESMALGVGMVHQNQMLIDDFTVTENIILGGNPSNPAGIINFKTAEKRVREIINDLGSTIDPKSPVSLLDPFDRQTVELAKVLYRNAGLIILDEPTTLLAPKQTEKLFGILYDLKNNGKTIILVTHRIAEVETIVDDVMILGRGKLVEHCASKSLHKNELVSLIMTGSRTQLGKESVQKRNLRFSPKKKKNGLSNNDVLYELADVSTRSPGSGRHLEKLSLRIMAGEIVGITGVPGNGQQHLLELAAGLRKPSYGRIYLSGSEIQPNELKNMRKKTVGCIFPQRDEQGLIPSFSIEENLLLNRRSLQVFSVKGWLKTKEIAEFCRDAVRKYNIKNAVPGRPVSSLSGGNRQKVVLARELVPGVKLIVAGEPSRGLDIKTTEDLKTILLDMRASGAGMLIISGDLDFLFSVSDRIGVLYKGAINYLEDSAKADAESISHAMLGYK